MEKNNVIAGVLIALVLVGYTFVQVKFFPPASVKEAQNKTAVENVVNTENTSVATDSTTETPEWAEEKEEADLVENNYVITTDKVKVTFTNRGGDIIGYELLEHFDYTTNKNVEMADNISSANRALSISFGGADSQIINDLFEVKEFPKASDGSQKIAFIKNYKDFSIAKQFTFIPGEYAFKMVISIFGKDGFKELNYASGESSRASYTIRTSPQIGPFYNPKVDRYESREFIACEQNKGKKIALSNKQAKEYKKEYKWAGVGGKYFCELIVPVEYQNMSNAFYSANVEINDYANAQAFLSRKPITSKQTDDTYYVYIGPRNEKELKKYGEADKNGWKMFGYNLTEALKTSGFLGWIETGLKWVMEMLYKVIPNWGLTIIVLTIILKAAMIPITKNSLAGTEKMKELQPRMKVIQDKYKDNPTKLQEETAKLYKETGYNPMAGCLPMIIQMVLLFAMFNLFNNYFEFRGAGFISGWIDDLSSGDVVYIFNFSIPFIGNTLRILPIIYLASQLLYGKFTNMGGTANAASSGMQMKIMTYVLPIVFFFMFYNAPAGLLLFWTVSNVFQLIQQIIMNKVMAAKKEASNENVIKFPKKK